MRADVGSVHLMLSNSACRYIHCIARRESLTSNVAVFDVAACYLISFLSLDELCTNAGIPVDGLSAEKCMDSRLVVGAFLEGGTVAFDVTLG